MPRFRRVGRQPDPYIPTATMADIVFLLIIYFVVSFNVEVDKARVELPRTLVREAVPREAAYVSVDQDGVIRVSAGKESSVPVPGFDEVRSFAADVVTRNPKQSFVVKADSTTRYQVIDRIIDALRQARAQTIYLLSDQLVLDDEA